MPFKLLPTTLALASLLTLCAATPTWADSTSSASSAASTSIGSSSTSIEKSSNSSSTKDQVKEGKYAVVDMAAMLQHPDMVRVRLQPVAPMAATPADSEFYLVVPQQTAERAQLAVGQVVTAAHRPYGLAFAVDTAGSAGQPFFLVLDDAWFRELQSRPLGV